MFNWFRKIIKAINVQSDKGIEQWIIEITKGINESDQIQHP